MVNEVVWSIFNSYKVFVSHCTLASLFAWLLRDSQFTWHCIACVCVCVGTLLRKLEGGLRGVSHVIVDEIHERDINVCCCKSTPRMCVYACEWVYVWVRSRCSRPRCLYIHDELFELIDNDECVIVSSVHVSLQVYLYSVVMSHCLLPFSALTLVIGQQEGHPAKVFFCGGPGWKEKTSVCIYKVMCKNWENGAKMADFEKVRTGHERWLAQWPEVRLRHGPIACWPGGVANSLWWGTVSNAFVLYNPVLWPDFPASL